MDTRMYENKPADYNFGLDEDDAIRIKERGRYEFHRGHMELLARGAKVFDTRGDLSGYLPNLDTEEYLRCNFQEFVWIATYRGGEVLKQFEDDNTQHHFGDIDLDRLVKIEFVSNFDDDTSNSEKRVVVSLDWATGKFSFLNGYVHPDVRNRSDEGFPLEGAPKLILWITKRSQAGVSVSDGAQVESTLYTRYQLGWEVMHGGVLTKLHLCIEPNGFIHYWHKP